MNPFAPRHWTSCDGLRLLAHDYAAAAGEARLPVICLHGLTRNARDFERVAPAIAAGGRRVLVPDVRGRGRSAYDPQPMNYTTSVYARDVVELCGRLGVARAVFVGTSMGGLITMALAQSAPGLVAAAVLNDIGPEIAPAGLARIAGYVGAASAPKGWSAAAAHLREVHGAAFPDHRARDWRTFARRLFTTEPMPGGSRSGAGAGAGALRLDYDPAIADAMRAGGEAPAPASLWPGFDALATGRELLLVRGGLSDLLARSTCDAMAARAAGLRIVEVPRVGHAPSLQEPAASAALADFLGAVA